MTDELLKGGEYYPWDIEAMLEALEASADSKLRELAEALEAEEYEDVGQKMHTIVFNYWNDIAEARKSSIDEIMDATDRLMNDDD